MAKIKILVLSKGIDKGRISTVKGLESYRFRALNEGLTLETSAF